MIDSKAQSFTSLSYRPYLDGLRAVAVALVFLFHARPGVLPGGFLGVDMFFVLSGYLISRILTEERTLAGQVDLSRFYARRVRRLTPAIVVLLAAVIWRTAVAGSILTVADRLRDVVATALYVANWNLVATSDDYFAGFSEASPLRHAWSLAIEEQFYLFWPLAILLIFALARGSKTRMLAATAATATASVALMAIVYDPNSVAIAYYRTDTRIHQLLIGAMLGIALSGKATPRIPKTVARVSAAGSLAALVGLSFVWTGSTAFYYQGGSVLVAVLSAALVLSLEATPGGNLARVLSTGPAVLLGKISYGFYLWHWPIILWWPNLDPTWLDVGLQAIATFVLSLLSWLLIERPIRQRQWVFSRLGQRTTVAVGVCSLVLVAGVAVIALQSDTQALAADALDDPSSDLCPDNWEPCVKVDGGVGSPVVALVGDSTAQAYGPALVELAESNGWTYVQAAVGGCPIGVKLMARGKSGDVHTDRDRTCFDRIPGIYDTVLEEHEPDLVVATARVGLGNHLIAGEGSTFVEAGTDEHLQAFGEPFAASIDLLTSDGAFVLFLELLPVGADLDCLESDEADACDRIVYASLAEFKYNEVVQGIAETEPNLATVSLLESVCPDGVCPLVLDGTVVRYDGMHFTGTMSRSLSGELAAAIEQAGIELSSLARP